MDFISQYDAKKHSPDYAISLIKNDDTVLITGEPGALLDALCKAKECFNGLQVIIPNGTSSPLGADIYAQEMQNHINVVSIVLGQNEENAWPKGVDQALINFSEAERYIENTCRPTVLLAHCTPPDDDGYFYFGIDAGFAAAALIRGARVIVQVNNNMPTIYSDFARVHISNVVAICEMTEPLSFFNIYQDQTEKDDTAIAGFVAERINNGSTIQLGAGCLPNTIGLSLVNHKDLGIHTDFFNSSLVKLINNGTVNNSKKELYNTISVGGYFCVQADEIKYINKNPYVIMKKMSWVCDPHILSQMSNMISVNTGLVVDFRGQMCTNNLGSGFTGGVGSHLDFARGAKRSKDGKSFIVMHSTSRDQSGTLVSNILPTLPDGSLVSIPRSDIMFVVTEFGAVNLRDMSIKERVSALISIAHPDFREWLSDEAKECGYV